MMNISMRLTSIIKYSSMLITKENDMSQCVKCFDFYHPDMIVYQEVRGEEVKVCAFCRLDKTEITIVDEETGRVKEVINKKQASTNYKKWLGELKGNPKIAKIIDDNIK